MEPCRIALIATRSAAIKSHRVEWLDGANACRSTIWQGCGATGFGGMAKNTGRAVDLILQVSHVLSQRPCCPSYVAIFIVIVITAGDQSELRPGRISGSFGMTEFL